MVNIRINLLKQRRVLSEHDYLRERKVLHWSIVALVVVIVTTISLFIWNFVLTERLAKVGGEVVTATRDMQGYVQASTQQVYLKNRFDLILNFLQERSLTREALQHILATSIPGTHIASIVFGDKTTLTMQVSSDSSASLSQLLTYYQTDTGYFTQVVSSGISRDKDGEYRLSMNLSLPQGEK